MTDDTDGVDFEAVSAQIEDARLVYGAALVDGKLHFVECIDERQFSDGNQQTALYTAFNSIGADLVPMVAARGDEQDAGLPASATPYRDNSVEPPRLTSFEHLRSVLPDAMAYYLLVNADEDDWKRIQNTVPDQFSNAGPISEPSLGRYVVASALVDETKARFDELPDGVNAEDIRIIDWST